MILVTRPLPKLRKSVLAFERAGIDVVGVATLDIIDVPSSAAALNTFFNHNHACVVMVTSVYAVSAAAQALMQSSTLNSKPTVIAVGDATARALTLALPMYEVVTPPLHSSEGIVAMHQLNEANCKQAVIIKGEGGRDLIAKTLQQRAIQVESFCVYKREQLTPPIYTKTWKVDDVRGIIATSENMAQQLIETHDATLLSVPWLTVSERVADVLHNKGISDVSLCHRATDNALIAWIKENWE